MVLFLCSLLCRVTQLAFFLFPQVSNLTVTSAKEGVERVRQSNGDFAFHSDSNTLEYHRILKKPCNLVEIGTFGGAFVGWGLQKHSKIKDVVDKAILHLYGSGEIERLTKKWWKGECTEDATVTVTSGADHAAAATLDAVILGLLASVAVLYLTVI